MAETKTRRQRKDPAETARAALEKANKLVEWLEKRHAELKEQYDTVGTELAAARVRRDYLAGNPDLNAPARPAEEDRVSVSDSQPEPVPAELAETVPQAPKDPFEF
jgi:hypothetical protein